MQNNAKNLNQKFQKQDKNAFEPYAANKMLHNSRSAKDYRQYDLDLARNSNKLPN